jgi:uncharacterized protein
LLLTTTNLGTDLGDRFKVSQRGSGPFEGGVRRTRNGLTAGKARVTSAAPPSLFHSANPPCYFAVEAAPSPTEVTRAFWGACHGGQQSPAEYLLDRGAELNWIPPWEEVTPLDAAQRSGADELVEWLRARGAKSVRELA